MSNPPNPGKYVNHIDFLEKALKQAEKKAQKERDEKMKAINDVVMTMRIMENDKKTAEERAEKAEEKAADMEKAKKEAEEKAAEAGVLAS